MTQAREAEPQAHINPTWSIMTDEKWDDDLEIVPVASGTIVVGHDGSPRSHPMSPAAVMMKG
jgi:hypothetical protein